MEQIILHGINATDFYSKFEKLEKQLETVLKLVGHNPITESETRYLSRKDVCLILKISLPTLNTWTKEGKLPSYRIGTRILYKPDEVNKALIKIEFKAFKRNNHGA
jgi:excisionase family DNA binding protein